MDARMSRIVWAAAVVLVFQAVVLGAVYVFYRRHAEHDTREFRAFRGVYVIAAAIMTAGPLLAAMALARHEPYPTPVGPIDPLVVTGTGMDAWVVGFLLYLGSFVAPWAMNRLDVA